MPGSPPPSNPPSRGSKSFWSKKSRFWAVEDYKPGGPQPSFDKQYVRDWLAQSGWNKEPPAPALPDDVVRGTADRYREAYRRLTGQEVI